MARLKPRTASSLRLDPHTTRQSRPVSCCTSRLPSQLANRSGSCLSSRSMGQLRSSRRYICLMARDVLCLCPQIRLFQPVRSTSWNHAMQICTRVEPPHCRALSSTTRTGLSASRWLSITASRRRCGALSLKRMFCPVSLSLMVAQVAAQYSKSCLMRRRRCWSGGRVGQSGRSASRVTGNHCSPTRERVPQAPWPVTGSQSTCSARWRRSFSSIIYRMSFMAGSGVPLRGNKLLVFSSWFLVAARLSFILQGALGVLWLIAYRLPLTAYRLPLIA